MIGGMLASGDEELAAITPVVLEIDDERKRTLEKTDDGVGGVTSGGGTVGEADGGNTKLATDELGVRLGALLAGAVELAPVLLVLLSKLDEVAFRGMPTTGANGACTTIEDEEGSTTDACGTPTRNGDCSCFWVRKNIDNVGMFMLFELMANERRSFE